MFARVVSALVVPALLIGSVASAPPVTAAAPAPPATLAELSQALQMFQGLADSTANQSPQSASLAEVSDIFGWEMAAIGIAGSAQSTQQAEQQLQSIETQIAGIQNTISTISNQITALSNQIAALAEQLAYTNCSLQSTTMTAPLSNIGSVQFAYTTLVDQATSAASGVGVAPTWAELVSWAQTAVSGQGSITVALNSINNVLVGTTDDGSIAACAQALTPTAGTSTFGWEQAYYSQVYTYVAYWYQQQVLALNLYVQAMHILAIQASGDPTQFPVGDPSAACTPPLANGDMVTACNLAADAVAALVDAITSQFMAAGAPYSWGTGGQVFAQNPAGGQAYAWLMDINDFQTQGCTLPVSSTTAPCGGSVGTSSQFANPTWGDFAWGQYTGWVPAKTVAWQSIGIQPATSTNAPIWQTLQQIGLGDATWGAQSGLNNLIIYTGEVANASEVDMFYMGDRPVFPGYGQQPQWRGLLVWRELLGVRLERPCLRHRAQRGLPHLLRQQPPGRLLRGLDTVAERIVAGQ